MANDRTFQPKLQILPAAQRALWPKLSDAPREFTLYGGTAIALQLGHRESIDFDFFGSAPFDPDQLARSLPILADAEIVQRDINTLMARVNCSVLVSFFATPQLGRVEPPLVAVDNGVRVASLIDLAGMKADVVQKRAEAKDYIDMDALLSAGIALPYALAAARIIQGQLFNPQITLKALSYFAEGNLGVLSPDIKRRLQEAVRDVDLDRLPSLSADKAAGE